jgi:methionyl-tRNA formyltransferase
MSASATEWWRRPRQVAVIVDNPSWVLPWAEQLVAAIRSGGEDAVLLRESGHVLPDTTVAFYLGCIRITPQHVLARARRNLVVHASDLPKGRGFSPLTWQIIEGAARIPVCLIEAAETVDAGPIIYKEWIDYRGDELIDELRAALGAMHVALCSRFLAEAVPPPGAPQQGLPHSYPRRRPVDSRLDPELPLSSQFDLLRTVDNEKYPAWFEFRGSRYTLKVEKSAPVADASGTSSTRGEKQS